MTNTIPVPVRRKREVSPSVHPLLRLSRYNNKYHTQALQAITCSILNKLLAIAAPSLIGMAVDVMLRKQASLIAQLGVNSASEQLLIVSLLTLIVWGLKSAFQEAYCRLWRELAQELRLQADSYIQKFAYWEKRSAGAVISIFTDEINQLERFIERGINTVIQVTTEVLIISFAFFFLSPNFAWLAMLPMPFIVCGSLALQPPLAPLYTDIALPKASTPLSKFIIVTGFITTMFMGGKEVLAGNLSVSSYIMLLYLTQSLLIPLSRIVSTFGFYRKAMVSINRVMDVLESQV